MEKNPYASSSSTHLNNMMITPSSSFKPILNDQDYMELVCENGQILAKSRRRPNNNGSFQNQRTQSLLDLYEIEYDEGFKKDIKNLGDTHIVPIGESHQRYQHEEHDELMNNDTNDDSLKGLKNIEVIKAIPDEQSVAVGRSTELYFASSSMFSQGTWRDLSCCSLKNKYGDNEDDEEEEEESTYLSNNSEDDESYDVKTQVSTRTRKMVTKRKRNTEVHKLSERKRRNEINKKMRALQDLLPNCYKDDKASLLDEAIVYMRTLQLQVQMMSTMGNGLLQPPTMLPMGHYSPMGLGMHIGATGATTATTSIPQFMPMNVQGTGFSGMNNASSQSLSFLNHHPIGLIPNSTIFPPLESCSQQFVVPSYVPHTQATTSFTQFSKSESSSNLEDAMQFRGSNGL